METIKRCAENGTQSREYNWFEISLLILFYLEAESLRSLYSFFNSFSPSIGKGNSLN